MRKKLNFLLLLIAMAVSMQAVAAVPSGYYNNAKNKSDKALMSALHQIIRGHTKRSYTNLWSDFKTTDCNGMTIIDRYSTTQFTYSTNQCGTYNALGDCYNREHSIPNSWWGSSSSDTAYTDLHHMFPVDGWVNSQRGNYPFGDCANGTAKGTGKLGSCTFSGYNGTVFEVADEYKGDFARVYFYFATRYMSRIGDFTNGTGSVVFTTSTTSGYLGLTTWAINQLLEWHRNDPVSTLETTRNDAVDGIQHNRNPFIDNPELVEYIWGNMKGNAWGNGTTPTPTPTLTAPTNGSTVNVGTNTGSGVSKTITVSGSNLTTSLSVTVSGNGFIVSPTTLSASSVNNGTSVTVTYNGTATNATGTLTISSSEVSSTVNLTASYSSGEVPSGDETIETWEGCGTGGYWTKDVQGHTFSWYFTDAGIWADNNKNGALSCRLGKSASSSIHMTQDVAGGASKISFYAANWSANEAAPTIQVMYSTNSGSTWTAIGSCSPNTAWQQYSFVLNVTGNVRFKIQQTAGGRLNIDDITITSNSTPVLNPTITISALSLIEAEQGGASSVVRGTVTTENNDENINLTVSGNFQISLNKTTWFKSLVLDPSGEVFYVRLENTNTAGEFNGTIQASTTQVSASADVDGVVNEKAINYGDVNMDGTVGISDVTALIDYLLGGNVSPFDADAADVNQDGMISIGDVTSLIDMLLGSGSKVGVPLWDAMPAVGGVAVENPEGIALEIYNLDGICVSTISESGIVELTAGIYVVASDDISRKVVVK
ncbi:MAG: endonuclease [Muribaculaceae bacterium]|nr:endonuclease [Muribaculaceae bacterium]